MNAIFIGDKNETSNGVTYLGVFFPKDIAVEVDDHEFYKLVNNRHFLIVNDAEKQEPHQTTINVKQNKKYKK